MPARTQIAACRPGRRLAASSEPSQEAILTRVEGGDRQYAFLGPGFEWDEVDPDAWQPPGMVLGDERNRELWLSGCSGGYRGTGPHAAAYILLKEGFRLNSFSLC